MQQVVTINLGGKAYQFDQDAYDTLRRYLAAQSAKWRQADDRQAQQADLEREIGKHCDAVLHADKNVVDARDLREILRTLDAANASANSTTNSTADTTFGSEFGAGDTARDTSRKLYQIRDGAVISGVCQGLSEYFTLDVTLIRGIFVVLALLTSGSMLVVYLVMMFLIPYDPTRPPSMEHGIPAWTYNFVCKAKRVVSN